MDVQVDNMPMNPSTTQRTSVFRAIPRLCSPLSTPPLTTMPASPSSTAIDGVNLSSALTALKVSLKRDFESFAPPTPAVSPAHGRSVAKRSRFGLEEPEAADAIDGPRVRTTAASTPPQTVNAFLAVSNRIKIELDKRRRKDRDRAPKPRRRQQLSYFAIVGAFQRAAHERKVAMQLECVVKASTTD